MIKQLGILLFKLITEPTPTWRQLSEKQDPGNEYFYKGYLFPIVGMIALLSFVGVLITYSFDIHWLQTVLKVVIKQVIIYGGSFYIIAFILAEHLFPRFGLSKNKELAERFTGYSSSLVYVVAMIKALFPSLFFLEILVFYTTYILWTGTTHFLKIKEDLLIKFTIFATAIILFIPFLVDRLIGLLMPGMKT